MVTFCKQIYSPERWLGSAESLGTMTHSPVHIFMSYGHTNLRFERADRFLVMVSGIVYSIFALYRDTKTIHSIMMIWLVIFIISNYNLASGPPKDPGGVKKHIFKIKGH